MLEMLFSRFWIIPTLAYPLQTLSLTTIDQQKDIETETEDDSRAVHILNIRRTTPYNLRITSCRCLYVIEVRARGAHHSVSAVHAVGD